MITATSDGRLAREFALRDQIRRAAVSIAANIAEGFGRGGRVEFARFLDIARGSAYELDTLIRVAHEAGMLDDESFRAIVTSNRSITGKIAGLTSYLRSHSDKEDGPTANREPRTANHSPRKKPT